MSHPTQFDADRKTGPARLAAIGLVSAGVVLSEVSLTRLFSVTIWYHYSFVAVSLALLGMTSAAVLIHRSRGRRLETIIEEYHPLIPMLAGYLLVLGLSAYLAIDCRGTFMEDSSSPFRLLPTLLFLPGFFFAGLLLCWLITRYARDIDRLYFADLLAAGLGGAGSVLLLHMFSGPIVVGIAAVLIACACPSLLVARRDRGVCWVRMPIFLSVLVLAVVVGGQTGLFTVRYTKDYDEQSLEKVHEKWSALARITVFRHQWFKKDKPYGWGLSKRYAGPPADEMWLEQDASAGSPIVGTDGDLSKLEFLDWDVTAAAYSIRGYDRVAVIGLGGGRDALTALRHGATAVWGVEINPDIVDLITNRFADFVGHVFDGPPVNVVVADGRTFMEQTKESFDLIQISLIDSWAASAAGAYILAENNLYTVEAFESYLDRLGDDGVLTVSRWSLTTVPGEVIRLVAVALEALKLSGVEDPSRHVAVVRGELVGTVLVKATPFREPEIERLAGYCDKMGFESLYLPGLEGGLQSVALVVEHWEDLDGFLAQLPYDFSPPTDDKPFFFLMLKPLDALLFAAFTWDTGLKQNFAAVRTLYVLFFVLLVIVLLAVLWPACRMRKNREMKHSPVTASLLFMFLGLGFMLVEIPLIQKLVLVLGHPVYALSVVLTSLLVFTGFGAAFSRRLVHGGRNPARRLAAAMCVLVALLLVLFAGGLLSHELLVLPTFARFSICIACTGLAGFLMGLSFPSAILALEQGGDRGAIPWLWAVNGAAGVLGSVLAFAVALLGGFAAAITAGAVCYLLAAALFARLIRG